MAEELLISFVYFHYFWKTHRLKINVPGHIDRLTFVSAGNESKNQANSFPLSSSPRETLLRLGWRRRRRDSDAANVSAPLCSLLRRRERFRETYSETGKDRGVGRGLKDHYCHLIFHASLHSYFHLAEILKDEIFQSGGIILSFPLGLCWAAGLFSQQTQRGEPAGQSSPGEIKICD